MAAAAPAAAAAAAAEATTTPPPTHSPDPEPRRDFMKKSLAVLAGGAVAIVPVAAGVLVATDPLRRAGGTGGDEEFLEITRLDALPADGSPRKFQVVADRRDAWNLYRNVPVGAVYLRRVGPGQVKAFNVVCPHAGCAINVAGGGQNQQFFCPCHNSGFDLDGNRLPNCVSPRPMDELAVDPNALAQGVVKVKFQNFRTGTHEKVVQS
jgi:menaquinol-cytochrome c reductase iron-sulfur subunit